MKAQYNTLSPTHRQITLRHLRLLAACAIALLASTPLLADAAQDCMQQKDPEAQIRACSEYLQLAQDVPEQQLATAYYFRGNAYIHQEKYDLGRRDLDHAISMNPKHYLAYVSRGSLERFLKQYDSSLQDFTQALEILEPYSSDPKNTAYINWLKDTVEAARYYKEREERWVEYLKEIQNDHDCQNWSALPYDLYRINTSKSGKALPGNAEVLSDNTTLRPCDSPPQTRQADSPQQTNQEDQSTASSQPRPRRPVLAVVLVGVILVIALFSIILFFSR